MDILIPGNLHAHLQSARTVPAPTYREAVLPDRARGLRVCTQVLNFALTLLSCTHPVLVKCSCTSLVSQLPR